MPSNGNDGANSLKGMITVSQVARILGVHPNTVRNWSDRGILKTYRLGHRRDRRFNLEDVNQLLTIEQAYVPEPAREQEQLLKRSRILG